MKELNLTICKELETIAKDVFNKYSTVANVAAGVYTTKDILKAPRAAASVAEVIAWSISEEIKNTIGEKPEIKKYYVNNNGERWQAGDGFKAGQRMEPESREALTAWEDEARAAGFLRSVAVGSFRCEFLIDRVFDILAQFEKMAGLKGQKVCKFVAADPDFMEVCKISIDVSKDLAGLAGFCSDDDLRPSQTGVFVDLSGWFLACDTHRIFAVPSDASLVSGSLPDFFGGGVIVPAKTWKNIAGFGALSLVVSEKNKNYFIDFVGADGVAVASCPAICEKYPDWRRVVPKIDANEFAEVVVKDLEKEVKKAVKMANKSTQQIYFGFSGETLEISGRDIDFSTEYTGRVSLSRWLDRSGVVSFRGSYILEACKYFDGRMFFVDASRAGIFTLKNGGFYLNMPMMCRDIDIKINDLPACKQVDDIYSVLRAAEDQAKKIATKEAKKAKKAAKVASVASAEAEAVAVAAYPCTAGERCDVYEGAPVRELLAVYDSAEAVAVDPALLPVPAAVVCENWKREKFAREYFNILRSVASHVSILSRCANKANFNIVAAAMVQDMSDELREALAARLGACNVAPVVPAPSVVGSSRPSVSGGDRFRMWWRSLAAAVVALLAWCGLSLSSGQPSEAAPDEADTVAAVVILPAVECVAVVPGVALHDVVCIGDAVPLELPAVDCVASSPARLAVAAVTAQDLAACGSSGGLSSPVVASVAVPAVVPGLVSSPSVFASL